MLFSNNSTGDYLTSILPDSITPSLFKKFNVAKELYYTMVMMAGNTASIRKFVTRYHLANIIMKYEVTLLTQWSVTASRNNERFRNSP